MATLADMTTLAELLAADGGSKGGEKMFFYQAEDIVPVTDHDIARTYPPEEREAFFRDFASGGTMTVILSSPELTVILYKAPPGMHVPPHHHGVRQMTYMLKGELRYGARVTRPGGGVYVPARKYTWTAGPEGAEFLEIFAGSPTGTII